MRNTFVALLSILASIAPTCALAQLSPGWLPNISSWEQQETRIYAADTGAANAYTVTLSPAPTIVAGSVVVFKAANANTGASTLAVNGGTATAIRKNVSVALATGDILAGQIVTVRYDGTNWQMGAGGSSIYFGQGDAAAAAGNNAVTLGSTPLSGSLSIFVGGQILRPSTAYTLSGTAASLTSSLTSGQVVVANWATSNATPGGITLSTAGGITGIAGWRMNEGSGLTLNDIGGSSDNATISASGAVTWQSNAGFAGTTPLWNGSGNAVASSTTLTNFDGTTAFSVAAWIKTSSTSEEAFMGTLNASAGNYQGWEIQKRSSGGQLLFFLINNYPTNYVSVYGSTVIDNGSLHYVVATYDGSRTAAGVKLYVDGSLETMTVVSNNLSATSANSLPARFGARNNASDEYTGVLAFTEIWNSVLTSTQVSTFYAAGPQLN